MPELTPADRESLARLYCKSRGLDPDESPRGFTILDAMFPDAVCPRWGLHEHRMADFYAMYRACVAFDLIRRAEGRHED